MKPFFDVMFDRTGSLILLAAYILVLGQILICLEIIHLRPYVHAAIISFTHFAVGFAILMLLETGHWEVTWDGRMNGSYGPFVQFFLDVPWIVYALLELVSLLMLVFSGVQLRLFVGRHVTTASIKSAIDLLPSGICFADSDGITLSNRGSAPSRRTSPGSLSRKSTGSCGCWPSMGKSTAGNSWRTRKAEPSGCSTAVSLRWTAALVTRSSPPT